MTYYITEKCRGCTSCSAICPTGAATGEKKKQHSINAEYCIDCGACGRVCPAGAVEDGFGEVSVRVKRREWLQPVFDKKTCTSCVVCLDACPVGCIVLGKPEKKNPNSFPELISKAGCIGCGFCSVDCPVDAITMAVPVPE
jgi:ferredoxin